MSLVLLLSSSLYILNPFSFFDSTFEGLRRTNWHDTFPHIHGLMLSYDFF